ncbi:MAG: pirin family protein [Parvibaculaceae bacterium]
MSWLPGDRPECTEPEADPSIETVVVPRARDLGGFEVRRVLPSAKRRMVGPFVFLDQMGPATFPIGEGIDVRPHPHIGLATITYLFEGTIVHRDSLGVRQPIVPGDVNWMTAGRGIVHSERSDPVLRQSPQLLYGLQIWVALPSRLEETEPYFTHYAGDGLPQLDGEGINARVVAGAALGRTSPVKTLSELFYIDVALEPGAVFMLSPEHEERAAYLLEGRIEIERQTWEAGQLLVFAPGRPVAFRAVGKARFVTLGGEPMDGPRHIWWNFVSSRKERIEQAKADWKRNRFDLVVPGETEFIPLPEGP